jgi:hypothetical protein
MNALVSREQRSCTSGQHKATSGQHKAAAQGNPLVAVSQMVGDVALVEALTASGFRRHCDFL